MGVPPVLNNDLLDQTPMKKVFTLLAFACAFHFIQAQTYYISDSLIDYKTKDELLSDGFIFARYGCNVYRITYNTIEPDSTPTVATGAIIVPWTSGCAMPAAVYCHGTISKKTDAPSYNLSGEVRVGQGLASDGYLSVLPDYLELGGNDYPHHPYIHAHSEATASIDLLRAAREWCTANGYQLNGEVFIAGYSQGGHSAAATARMMQENHSAEFNLVAWAGGSGPYDVSGVQETLIRDTVPYPDPGYLPFLAVGYQEVYGNLYDSLSQAFRAPYDSVIGAVFNGEYGMGTANANLPPVPRDMIDSAYFADYVSDPNHPLRIALRDNDVYDWAPSMPTVLYYCPMDSSVTYLNSIVARDTMIANGATDVTAVLASPTDGHTACAFTSLFAAKGFFDTYANVCNTTGLGELVQDFKVYPNPTSDVIHLPLHNWNTAQVNLLDITGRLVYQKDLMGGDERTLYLDNLAPGTYLLELNSKEKRAVTKVVVE